MLKLVNIVKNDDYIEADYIPENSTEMAHVRYSITTGKGDFDLVDGYSGVYGRHAIEGLKRTISELESGGRKELPEERLVMWY